MSENARPDPVSAEELIFEANLTEFASRVQIICSLEAAGHLSPQHAYTRIKCVWKELNESKKNLGIG